MREDQMMKLDKGTVSAGTQVMLPIYVLVFAWIGGSYLLSQQTDLLQTPALRYANEVLDLRIWGALALLIAGLIPASWIADRRSLLCYTLLFGMLCCGIWVAVFVAASVLSNGSPSGGAWPLLGVGAFFATYRSVARGERGL